MMAKDAEKFLDTGGYKGPQVGVLRPDRYRINTLAFNITKDKATKARRRLGHELLEEFSEHLRTHLGIPAKERKHRWRGHVAGQSGPDP
jgi:hypothetical protein